MCPCKRKMLQMRGISSISGVRVEIENVGKTMDTFDGIITRSIFVYHVNNVHCIHVTDRRRFPCEPKQRS